MKYAASLVLLMLVVMLPFASCKKDAVADICPTRLEKITDKKGDMIAKFFYDGAGQLTKSIYVNFTTTEYFYQAGKLEHINFGVTGANVSSREYFTYDDIGRVISEVTRHGNGELFLTTTYTYNGDSRTCIYSIPTDDTSGYSVHELDDEGNVLQVKQYDVNDNMKYLRTIAYTYDYKRNPFARISAGSWSVTRNVLTETYQNPSYSDTTLNFAYTYNQENYPVSRIQKLNNSPSDTSYYVYGCE